MRQLFAALLILASACFAEYPRSPPPRILSAEEAVNIATHYARTRGVVIDYTRDVRLDRYVRWHVNLGGAGGRDRAVVTLDGYSGRVLAARLRGRGGESVPQPPPPGAPPEPPGAPPEPPAPGAPPNEGAPPPPPPAGDAPPELPGPPPPPAADK